MFFYKGTSIRVESPGNFAKTAGFLRSSVADGAGNNKKPRCLEWNPLNSGAYWSLKMFVNLLNSINKYSKLTNFKL